MKLDEALVEPLTYHKVKSDLEPEPMVSQASKQKRFEVYGQWYRRCDNVARKHKNCTKKSHIWEEEKGYAIIYKATGV